METKFGVFSKRVKFVVSRLFLYCLEHRRKVKQPSPSKPKEEEKFPTVEVKEEKQEVKPPSNSGKEKDLQLEKESVTGLDSVMNLFSEKVRYCKNKFINLW